MTVTKSTTAGKIAAYLRHELSLAELVAWSETVLMDGEIGGPDEAVVSRVVARLGVADVREFGLTWEDCEDLLNRLGFVPRVEVVTA